jgi:hypothetical protein
MLKSLFKKKNEGPTPEEILAIAAARNALVGRVDNVLSRAAVFERAKPVTRPVFTNPLENAA